MLNKYYKDFLSQEFIAFDVETKDPALKEKGPGQYRNDGEIVGYSLASASGASSYFDISHNDTTAETKERNLNFLAHVLSAQPIVVTANGLYDIDWLQNTQGVNGDYFRVPKNVHDIQYAEPLLDEYGKFSLNSLCRKYEINEKKETALVHWCEEQGFSGDPRKYIYKMPAKLVAEYAAYDALSTLLIYKKQLDLLRKDDLYQLFLLECAMLPILAQMRKTGVRIDKNKLNLVEQRLRSLADSVKKELITISGDSEFNPKSSANCAKLFDKLGVAYPRNAQTEKMRAENTPGSPQINTDFLNKIADKVPSAQKIKQWRHFSTLINTFILPYKNFIVGDRIHALFHPLRSDDYGTVSGRFSSSMPNLQQVDKTKVDLGGGLEGKVIRQLFIPEEDHLWACADQSQEEYRLIAHYATGPGADEFRAQYNDNPDFDMHDYIAQTTGFIRDNAKRLNFGGAYFLGAQTCATKFLWELDEAKRFLETYHKKVPFLRPTRDLVIATAQRRGYIKTILGRRARTHASRKLTSMFNRLIQGSAGDIMKKSLLDCYNAGIFTTLPLHITVHDEIDVSCPRTKEGTEALKEMCYLMENCVKLKVPLRVACETGENWGEAH